MHTQVWLYCIAEGGIKPTLAIRTKVISIMSFNRHERLLRMHEMINSGRCPNIDDFCREFEVKERTARHDLQYLRDFMDRGILFDKTKRGYINPNPKQQLPTFELDDGEVFALTLGRDMLNEYSGTVFEPILRTAIEKIKQRLPDRVKVEAGDLKALVTFRASGVAPMRRTLFFQLNTACQERHPVEITYFSAHTGETTKRKIDPYKLIENRGAWYVVGYCHLRKEKRMFALHRISGYRQLRTEKFQRPQNEALDNWINSAFQLEHGDPEMEYKIAFSRVTARYIRERHWHPSQKLEEHEDGSCILSFAATRLEEIKRWVLTFGAEAEVLAPVELREVLKKEIAKTSKLYS